jgi:hypothetical protein
MPDLLSYEIEKAAGGTIRSWIERYLRNLATISERFGLYRIEPLAGFWRLRYDFSFQQIATEWNTS